MKVLVPDKIESDRRLIKLFIYLSTDLHHLSCFFYSENLYFLAILWRSDYL